MPFSFVNIVITQPYNKINSNIQNKYKYHGHILHFLIITNSIVQKLYIYYKHFHDNQQLFEHLYELQCTTPFIIPLLLKQYNKKKI